MRLLDIGCCAGGASVGYAAAGFEVEGIDHEPQPDYPFPFTKMDMRELTHADLAGFDAVHISPPCQKFTRARHLRDAQGGKTRALNLIPFARSLVQFSGLAYVIENVPGAPLVGTVLCGSSFGLKVRRHRVFESNVWIPPLACKHKEQGRPVGVYHVLNDHVPQGGTTARDMDEATEAMGMDWTDWDHLKEAIPPAYTKYVGMWLRMTLEAR